MYISGIEYSSDCNGSGFRNVLYVSRCWWHCEGCHNPETHNKEAGVNKSIKEILEELCKNEKYINDITISGGDSLTFQYEETLKLLKELKHKNKNIWLYTGYTIEELLKDNNRKECLNYIDILVDGKFEKDKRDVTLLFRGSGNQRVIDVQKTLEKGEVILWQNTQKM